MSEFTNSRLVRFGFGLVGSIFILGSPVSGYFLIRIFLEARASADWPAVPGTISQANVAETGAGRFIADIEYNYDVMGRSYFGSRIRASDGEYQYRDGAEQAIDGLREGQIVEVYYNPIDPHRSVLHRGLGFQEYALLSVPIVMLAMGISPFWLLWQQKRSKRSAEF